MNDLTLENMRIWKARNPHWWWIGELTKDDVQFCENTGKKRSSESGGRGWGNRAKQAGSDDVHGAAGELAVNLVYNQVINVPSAKNYSDLTRPDIGGFIESKTSRWDKPHLWDLPVNEYNLDDDRAYVLTLTCLYPKWLITIGWAWGNQIREYGTRKTHSTSGHTFILMPRDRLMGPKSLFDVLR